MTGVNGEVQESSVTKRHYHLFANDKKALTASPPAAPPLWFSARFSPAPDKTELATQFFHFLSKNTWHCWSKGKSLHAPPMQCWFGQKVLSNEFCRKQWQWAIKRRKTAAARIHGHQFAPWISAPCKPWISAPCKPLQPTFCIDSAQLEAVPRLDQSDSAATFDFRAELQLFSASCRNEQTCWIFHQSQTFVEKFSLWGVDARLWLSQSGRQEMGKYTRHGLHQFYWAFSPFSFLHLFGFSKILESLKIKPYFWYWQCPPLMWAPISLTWITFQHSAGHKSPEIMNCPPQLPQDGFTENRHIWNMIFRGRAEECCTGGGLEATGSLLVDWSSSQLEQLHRQHSACLPSPTLPHSCRHTRVR